MPEGHILLPNFTTMGLAGFELRTNPHRREATEAALLAIQHSDCLSEEDFRALPARQIGLLASLSYPTCSLTQLDFIIRFLVHLDRILSGSLKKEDSGEEKAIINQLYHNVSESWLCRFNTKWHELRKVISVRSDTDLNVMDVCKYKTCRRVTSGILMIFDLIEYARGLHLPDSVHTFPSFQDLKQHAHDIIAWSQDLASFNRKQSIGDNYNLVAVFMARHGFVQTGVDEAREDIKAAFQAFRIAEQAVLATTPGEDLKRYVEGLRDCITGNAHWIYYTNVFFQDGKAARDCGWVSLIPKETVKFRSA